MKHQTDITVVIDNGYASNACRWELETAVNDYLDAFRDDSHVVLSCYRFTSQLHVLYVEQPLNRIGRISLDPYGSSAVYDSIVTAIDRVGVRLKDKEECMRPDQVIVVLATPFIDNDASMTYTKHHLDNVMEHQRSMYRWEFVVLPATGAQ